MGHSSTLSRSSSNAGGAAESTDLRYFDVEALPDNVMLAHNVRIRDALEHRAEPFIR